VRFTMKAVEDELAAERAGRTSQPPATRASQLPKALENGGRVKDLEAELARTRDESKKALAAVERALEAAERDAIKEELARDAAIGDLQMQVQRERELRVKVEKDHERGVEEARDAALLQALADLKANRRK